MVRPSALAVFRLMMRSNFTGCSTGRLAGFAPFQDSVHMRRGPAGSRIEVRPIAQQSAPLKPLTPARHQR